MKRLVIILFIFIFLLSVEVFSESDYNASCNKNEIMIFGFIIKDKRSMSVCAAEDESYIVYRYGTKKGIEMEFPDNKTGSWAKFKYSYYFRGGSAENEGMDINYLEFENRGYRYTIYEEYTAADNIKACGIKITDTATSKETVITGIPSSIKGSLTALRDYSNIRNEE